MQTSGRTLEWLLYSFLCLTADTLDTIFSVFYPEKRPEVSLKPSDTDSLSDEQIKQLIFTSPNVDYDDIPVFRISPGTVAKLSCDYFEDGPPDCSEANIARLVFEKTSIPVPRIRRVFHRKYDYCIVMDYIKGSTLAEAWPTYSLWGKMRVAFTLRRYVRQLRRLEAPLGTPPGPLSRHGPQHCDVASIFGQVRPMRGPFGSYKELSNFFNNRYRMGQRCQYPPDHPRLQAPFDDSAPLVITHNDLNPRNIIAGEDGRLWVLDWGWAGYYPPWFEYAAMMNQVKTEIPGGWLGRDWERIIPFVCGPYFEQHDWLDEAGTGLCYT